MAENDPRSFGEKVADVKRKAWAGEEPNISDYNLKNLYQAMMLHAAYNERDHPLEKAGWKTYVTYTFVIAIMLVMIFVGLHNRHTSDGLIAPGSLIFGLLAMLVIEKTRHVCALKEWKRLNLHHIYSLPEMKKSSQRFVNQLAAALTIAEPLRTAIINKIDNWMSDEDVLTQTEFLGRISTSYSLKFIENALHENLAKGGIDISAENLAKIINHQASNMSPLMEVGTVGEPIFSFEPGSKVPSSLQTELSELKAQINLPEALRNEHMHVVSGSGGGKTQLFQKMILDDVRNGNTVIVIDSQQQMIPKLTR